MRLEWDSTPEIEPKEELSKNLIGFKSMISAAMTTAKKGWKDNCDMNGIQTSDFSHSGAVVNLLYQTF